jgi:hypothetical protein
MRFIAFFILFSACSSQKEYRLVELENIQFLFERFVEDKSSVKKISVQESKKLSYLVSQKESVFQDSLVNGLVSEKQIFSYSILKNNLFSEFRGNVLMIHNLKKTKQFIQTFEQHILLDKNLKFYWDTLTNVKKLYVIDNLKGVKFVPKNETKNCNQQCTVSLELNPSSKAEISAYKANQIGKEFVLICNNTFFAGAKNIQQKENTLLVAQ